MTARLLAVVVTVVVGAGPARPAHADDKPWADGVSEADQKQALALYRDGNLLFERSACVEALAKYDRALAAWDHPAIRYNAAVCLIELDRPEEAYEYLLRALRFGVDPLGPDLYKQGLTYQKLLGSRLGQLEISCDTKGAQLTLDGKPLFVAPGTTARHLVPGTHQIVATEPAHQTETRSVVVEPGRSQRLVITLRRRDAPAPLERRWAAWKPWAVVIGGGLVAGAGIGFYFKSRADFDAFDAAVQRICPNGCYEPGLSDQDREDLAVEDSAKTWRAISYSALAVGAAGIGAGVALVILNQPRVAVTPTASADRAGLVISGRW